MVSKGTTCDRLVPRLVSYGEPEGVCSRLGMGMFLVRRASLSGEETRELPVDGIKGELVAHGQGGFTGICTFILGAGFLGGLECSQVGLCIRWMCGRDGWNQPSRLRTIGGVCVLGGSVGPITAEGIAAAGDGTVARNPSGMNYLLP
jgi:hypothetical protein